MPKNRTIRVIIDTNLWISFIISKKWKEVDLLLSSHKIRLLFSSELVQEIEAVVSKPKLSKYFDESAFGEMFNVFDSYIDFIKVKSKVNICRDSKDNFLLSLAVDAEVIF